MKYTEQIEKYLNKENYIKLAVSKQELEENNLERYFELFEYLENSSTFSEKFCGKMSLCFVDYNEEDIWKNPLVKKFVADLNEKCPYLFFYAEKEQGTLKILTILECAGSTQQGDNIALDNNKFDAYLKKELKGILIMSKKAGFTPERAQAIVQDVYNYFGI